MDPLPPLPALRALEAVVRHEGFGRAAEELGVTQSAVSQQLRSLEEWTGRKLLRRGPRRSTATADGRALAEAVAVGLGGIGKLCAELRRRKTGHGRALVVSTLPGFALKWLFPRLVGFDQAHPELPVSVSTDPRLVDFRSDETDVAIRYGLGDNPGLHSERLFGERLFPVCAPALLEGPEAIRRIEDLARHTILVDDVAPIRGRAPTWETWLTAAGLDRAGAAAVMTRTRRFGQANMVVQAAVDGLGVALGREPLVQDELAAGRLVRPFALPVPSEFAYYLVCPRENLADPWVAAFRDWLLTEAAAQEG